MLIKKRTFLGISIVLIMCAALILGLKNSNPMVWITFSILCLNIVIGFDDIGNRYTYVLFNVCFFTFLMGKLFFESLSGENTLSGFSNDTISTTLLGMTISLVCITVGMFISEKVKFNIKAGYNSKEWFYQEKEDSIYTISNLQVQVISIAFYVTYPFYLLTLIEKVLYVGSNSYLEYYTSYTSSIPYILIKIGELNLLLFVLLFCVQHEKKKLFFPTVLFLIASALSLGIGQRNIFVLNIIMFGCCAYYANIRSQKYSGQKLYGKKIIATLVVLFPALISFLYAWGNYRQDRSGNLDFMGGFKEFFVSQGGQIEFWANTVEYKSQIWAQKVPYTFASIYNYFRNLFGLIDFGTYTKENALYGNSLGATQFYITSPSSLESGKGAGCCYLSELYFDAGIIGIIIGSIFLGYVIRKLVINEQYKPWVNAFIILMIRWIIYIPRASYFDWISNTFNIWNIAIIIIIFNFVNLIDKSRNGIRT